MNDVKASAPEPSKTGRITEANVAAAMREIRTARLEADVNLEVARWFCDQV